MVVKRTTLSVPTPRLQPDMLDSRSIVIYCLCTNEDVGLVELRCTKVGTVL